MVVKRTLSAFLALMVLGTQCLFAYQPENNFWAERRKASRRTASTLLASLPLDAGSVGATSLTAQFPAPQRVGATLSPSIARSLPQRFSKDHAKILSALSPAHGTVRKVSLPKDPSAHGPVVIHIQDVHMNQEAQWNIRETVKSLLGSGQVNLVALEGATEPIDLQAFVDYPHAKAVEMAADYLLKENKISGPIHAALTARGKLPRILGIDDPIHYEANVQAYRDSAPKLEKTHQEISAIQKEIEAQKRVVFSPALQSFDQQVQRYRAGKSSLGEYVRLLGKETDPDREGFAVHHFLTALAMEQTLDFKQVEVERARLIERLTQTLTAEETNTLVAQSLDYRTGQLRYGDFYTDLSTLCEKKGIQLKSYPDLDSYVKYVLLADGIDAEHLMAEIATLEKTAYARQIKTPEEKSLAARSRQAWLTGKLVDFALTPAEWEEYNAGPRPLPQEVLSSFEKFYKEAHARDIAMAKNLLHAMKDAPSPSREEERSVSLLVTGGFHAEGMTQQLTQQGITVISYVPKIEKVDTAQGSTYLSVFTQEKSPLEKLFAGEKLFLANTPVSRLDLKLGIPLLVASASLFLGLLTATFDFDSAYQMAGGVGAITSLKLSQGIVVGGAIIGAATILFRVRGNANGLISGDFNSRKKGFAASIWGTALWGKVFGAENEKYYPLAAPFVATGSAMILTWVAWVLGGPLAGELLFSSTVVLVFTTVFISSHFYERIHWLRPKNEIKVNLLNLCVMGLIYEFAILLVLDGLGTGSIAPNLASLSPYVLIPLLVHGYLDGWGQALRGKRALIAIILASIIFSIPSPYRPGIGSINPSGSKSISAKNVSPLLFNDMDMSQDLKPWVEARPEDRVAYLKTLQKWKIDHPYQKLSKGIINLLGSTVMDPAAYSKNERETAVLLLGKESDSPRTVVYSAVILLMEQSDSPSVREAAASVLINGFPAPVVERFFLKEFLKPDLEPRVQGQIIEWLGMHKNVWRREWEERLAEIVENGPHAVNAIKASRLLPKNYDTLVAHRLGHILEGPEGVGLEFAISEFTSRFGRSEVGKIFFDQLKNGSHNLSLQHKQIIHRWLKIYDLNIDHLISAVRGETADEAVIFDLSPIGNWINGVKFRLHGGGSVYNHFIARSLLKMGVVKAPHALARVWEHGDNNQEVELALLDLWKVHASESYSEFVSKYFRDGGERQIADLVERAGKLGILIPYRFNLPILQQLIEMREEGNKYEKPWTTVFFRARSDWNNALYQDSLIHDLLNKGHHVIYVEVESIEAISRISEELIRNNIFADTILIDAHGNTSFVNFGKNDGIRPFEGDGQKVIDLNVEPTVLPMNVRNLLKRGGTVILNSCSNGASNRGGEKNVIAWTREQFPQAGEGEIFAPDGNFSRAELLFNSDGKVTGIKYENSFHPDTNEIIIIKPVQATNEFRIPLNPSYQQIASFLHTSIPSTLSRFWRLFSDTGPLNHILRLAKWESAPLTVGMGLAVGAHFLLGASLGWAFGVAILAGALGGAHWFGTYGVVGGKLQEVRGRNSLGKALSWFLWTSAFGLSLYLLGSVLPQDLVAFGLFLGTWIGTYLGAKGHELSNRKWVVDNLHSLTEPEQAMARNILKNMDGRPVGIFSVFPLMELFTSMRRGIVNGWGRIFQGKKTILTLVVTLFLQSMTPSVAFSQDLNIPDLFKGLSQELTISNQQMNIFYRISPSQKNESKPVSYVAMMRILANELEQDPLVFTRAVHENITEFQNPDDLAKAGFSSEDLYGIFIHGQAPVLYIRFAGKFIQALGMDRLNIFLEDEPGYLPENSKALEDSFLRLNYSGAAGHDFPLNGVAHFYSHAKQKNIDLNPIEIRVREELIEAGLIQPKGDGFEAKGQGALISTANNNRADIEHEFNHAVYFTDVRYRDAAHSLFDGLTGEEKGIVVSVLSAFFSQRIKEDADYLIREFTATFHDGDELLINYLNTETGTDVVSSKKGDDNFELKPYFNPETHRITPEAVGLIRGLEKKVREIDHASNLYVPKTPSTLEWFWRWMPDRGALHDVLQRGPRESVPPVIAMGLAMGAYLTMGASFGWVVGVALVTGVLGYSHRWGTYGVRHGQLVPVAGMVADSVKKATSWFFWITAFGGLLWGVGQVVPVELVPSVLALGTWVGANIGFDRHRRANREYIVNNIPDLTDAQRLIARKILKNLDGRPITMDMNQMRELVVRTAENVAKRKDSGAIDLSAPSALASSGIKFMFVTQSSLTAKALENLRAMMDRDVNIFVLAESTVPGISENRTVVVPFGALPHVQRGNLPFREVLLTEVRSRIDALAPNHPLRLLSSDAVTLFHTPDLQLKGEGLKPTDPLTEAARNPKVLLLESLQDFPFFNRAWQDSLKALLALAEFA